jgi:hypothetical protein
VSTACSVEAFHRAPPEQKRVSTSKISNQRRRQKGRPVHLSELDDDGGGRPWGHREAESGKGAAGEVTDAGEAESREGAAGHGDGNGRRDGRGTSMSSTTQVEARGQPTVGALGSSIGEGAADDVGDVGKQIQGRGCR